MLMWLVLQYVKHIRLEQAVVFFLDTARLDRAAPGSVSELAIRLESVNLDRLRNCLLVVPNLTDHTLTLPHHIPTYFLQGIMFPSLVFFKTNMPHVTLVEFLTAHPTSLPFVWARVDGVARQLAPLPPSISATSSVSNAPPPVYEEHPTQTSFVSRCIGSAVLFVSAHPPCIAALSDD